MKYRSASDHSNGSGDFDKGYTASMSARGEGGGSSYTIDENGGSLQRLKKFQEITGKGNPGKPPAHYGTSAAMLHDEAGVIPKKGSNEKY